jgi:hypothetical protein
MPWNIEIVLLIDKLHNIEIIGVHEGSDTNFSHRIVSSIEEALEFASEALFPSHGLIMRPDHQNSRFILSDIIDERNLRDSFHQCVEKSKNNKVFIESDMRAHRNPTRMRNIEKATQDMIKKLLNTCPLCQTPGFMISKNVKGLLCELCYAPTDLTLKHIYECQKCHHQNEVLYPHGEQCPVKYCGWCNP